MNHQAAECVTAELLTPAEPATPLVPAQVLPDAEDSQPRGLVPATLVGGRLRRALRWGAMAFVYLAGAVTLIVALAILATVPVLNFLSLGYLLEASGRVARTRRLSAGFIGLPTAAALGAIAFAAWVVRWPILAVSDFWYASHLIDPFSRATKVLAALWLGTNVALVLVPVALVVLAFRLRPRLYTKARDRVWHLATDRLPYYFWLGVRGFVGGLIWLVVPISLMAVSASLPPGGGAALSLLGGALLVPVLIYLPFLQTRFAAEGRFRAMFELSAVRNVFRRAPIAFWLALVAMLLFALPLYLLMIEAVPREVAWLPSLLFVVFLFPARLVAGWAYARGAQREKPRLWLFRWLARLGMLPPAMTYALLVWLSQYLLWYGVWSLYHQHAFLLPAPFLGL